MKEIIRLENIKRNFIVGDEVVHALRGVSFTIYEGEFVTIMGTSGSGKSTLLNTLGCLDTPTGGEYYLDGVSVPLFPVAVCTLVCPATFPVINKQSKASSINLPGGVNDFILSGREVIRFCPKKGNE